MMTTTTEMLMMHLIPNETWTLGILYAQGEGIPRVIDRNKSGYLPLWTLASLNLHLFFVTVIVERVLKH